MATIRGERFHIDLDEKETGESLEEGSLPPLPVSNFVADVQERQSSGTSAPQAPTFKSSTTGFPTHKKRTGMSKFKQQANSTAPSQSSLNDPSTSANEMSTVGTASMASPGLSPSSTRKEFISPADMEKHQIDQENNARIAEMSPEELAREREDLFANMSPALIQRLLQRSNIEDDSSKDWDQKQGRSGWNPSFASEEPPINASTKPTRPSPHGRKVSFAVPDEPEPTQPRRPTAERHSISLSGTSPLEAVSSNEIPKSPTKAKKRPSTDRKVSFAVAEDDPADANKKATAGRHSISSHSPSSDPTSETEATVPRRYSINPLNDNSPFIQPLNPINVMNSPALQALSSPAVRPTIPVSNPISTVDGSQSDPEIIPPLSSQPEEPSIHFPHPRQPDLDPSSATYLEDLHNRYFPNLSHDPSKLAWLQPTTNTSTENALYSSATASSIDPVNIRFDFQGNIIPPSVSETLPTNLGLHNHGDQPGAAGYTVPELARLARSAFPAQKCLAMQTLGRILFRLGSGDFGDENDLATLPTAGAEIALPGDDSDEARRDTPVQETTVKAERAKLAAGLWDSMEKGRVTDTLMEESQKTRGHQTSIAVAQEAVWLWRRGGGRKKKAV